MSKKFALTGAAGYVAPKHMKAIQELGHELVAAIDPSDSVGVIDNYFPQAAFFTEFERFDRHLEKIKRQGHKADYISVCSPNYLHDAHIRFGLRYGANVICEKPVVLNPWNLDLLTDLEKETGQKAYHILQLRLHPSIIQLKKQIEEGPKDKMYDITLTYITSRGHWYYASWKGEEEKSGGIATNIGIHFFDMLQWIFGDVTTQTVHQYTHDRAAGFIELKRARVRWFLSINRETLPTNLLNSGQRTYRSIHVEGKELEFSEGFEHLHSQSYKNIIEGKGFGLEEARSAVEMVYHIRNSAPMGLKGDYHPFCSRPLAPHPFKD